MNRPHRRDRTRTRFSPAPDRLEGRALMAFAGGLDPAFAAGGLYYAPLHPGTTTGLSAVTKIAAGPDGSIVELGPAGGPNTFPSSPGTTDALVKLTAGGALDTSFGTGGEADLTLPAGQVLFQVGTLLVQPGGQIVIMGTAAIPATGGPSISHAFVARFNVDGTPDATFGTDGLFELGPTGAFGEASYDGAAVQANGQVLLAGTAPVPGSTENAVGLAVTRLTLGGQLDTTFGTGGTEVVGGVIDNGSAYYLGGDVAVEPSGQVLVYGILATTSYSGSTPTTSFSPEIDRLAADGTPDPSFDATALLPTQIVNFALTVQPNGQIIAAGSNSLVPDATSPSRIIVARLNADGTLNKSATLPIARPSFPPGVQFGDRSPALGLEPDGDIVMSSLDSSTTSATVGLAVTRLTPALAPDPTFGTAGTAYIPTPLPAPTSTMDTHRFTAANSLVITPGGQILVAGTAVVQPPSGLPTASYDVVAELTATGTSARPGDLTGDGVADPAVYLTSIGAFAIADSSGATPGRIVPFGIPGPGQTIPAPGNYYGTGRQDVAAYLPASGTYAVQDPTGKTDGEIIKIGIPGPGQTIPAPGDYYGTGRDDVAIYLAAPGAFAVQDPTGKTAGEVVPFGQAGVGNSIPVPGDYDGTGRDDLAVYLTRSAVWAIQDPTGKTPGQLVQFGLPGVGASIPAPADYDGSGRTELGVYIPGLAEFVYRPADGGPNVTVPFGVAGAGQSLPAVADYTGTGRADAAAYLPTYGAFAYLPTGGQGAGSIERFGIPGAGQTIPATAVVLSPFPGSGGTVGGMAYEGPAAPGQADALDFITPPPTTSAKKAGNGGGTA